MDWSSILYAGLGGAIGGAIGGTIGLKISNKNIRSAIIIVSLLIGSRTSVALYKNEVFPRIIPMDISSLELDSPGLNSLRVNHPEKFKNLMNHFDGPSRRDNVTERDIAEYRNHLINLIENFKSRAPSKFSRKAMKLAVMQFEILEENNPEICTAQIQGTAYPVMTPILGEEYVTQENALLESLFALREAELKDPPDPSLGKDIYTNALIDASTTVGIALEDIATSNEHEKNCQLLAKITQNGLLLNDQDLRLFTAYQATE